MDKEERGQGLVETMLILPFLLILVVGIIEMGVVLNRQLVVVNAVREGARFGAFGAAPGDIHAQILLATSGMVEFTEENAVIAVIYATTDEDGSGFEEWVENVYPDDATAPHVTPEEVLAQLSVEGDPVGVRLVIVDVRYDHQSLLGMPFVGALSEQIPIGSWTAMRLPVGVGDRETACCVYPIALDAGAVEGLETGDEIEIRIGSGPGMFGWLFWDPDVPPSQTGLEANLAQPCLVAQRYRNPCSPADVSLTAGDWVVGHTGETVSEDVKRELDERIGNYIRIPLWDEWRDCGGLCPCNDQIVHVAGFAVVDIVAVDFEGSPKTISARFIRLDGGCE